MFSMMFGHCVACLGATGILGGGGGGGGGMPPLGLNPAHGSNDAREAHDGS